jgi:hypothetical protein
MNDQLAQLAAEAHLHKPRLFAIYGLLRNSPSTPDLLLWGLYFSTLDSLIYFDGETPELHRAYTPERLLEFYQRFADAHLEWFDHD